MRNAGMKLRSTGLPVAALACAVTSVAHAATWSGGATGDWGSTSPINWSGGDIPDTSTEDAQIDGNTSQATVVQYTLAASAQVGNLIIDSGDRLNLSKSSAGSYSLTAASLANKGTLVVSASWANNQSVGLTVTNAPGSPDVLNSGTLTISNTGTRTNPQMTLTAPGTNTNALTGVINISINIGGGGSSGLARLSLSGTGNQVFTNDGAINLDAGASRDAGTPTTSQSLLAAAASQNLTLDGSGKLTLSSLLGTTGSTSYAKVTGGSSSTLTNGSSHTIFGNGLIGGGTVSGARITGAGSFTSITNNGLIKSTGTNAASLAINPASAGTVTNAGRLVSASTSGVFIGNDTAASSFTNDGLLESRTGSVIAFGTLTTRTLNGTIAGGGTFTSALPLSSTAIFSPGDLSNTDGTGTSTIGTLTVDNTLTLGSAANFQIGPSSYDKALVNTITNATGPALTFDGALNVANLGLVTYADGQVYDLFDWGTNTTVGGTFDSIVLPSLPPNLQWKSFGGAQFDYATGQIVVEATPEPEGLALFGLIGAGLLRRNQKRNAVRLVEESNA